MRGNFDLPPSATGYNYVRPRDDGNANSLMLSSSPMVGGTNPSTSRNTLRPVFDFLLVAAVLLPWKLWGYQVEEQCSNISVAEPLLLRVARGAWIMWLTHAAGLMDEALRVFLGIRLTQGLGTPTSVDNVYSKMSRRVEVVAEVRFEAGLLACAACAASSLLISSDIACAGSF